MKGVKVVTSEWSRDNNNLQSKSWMVKMALMTSTDEVQTGPYWRKMEATELGSGSYFFSLVDSEKKTVKNTSYSVHWIHSGCREKYWTRNTAWSHSGWQGYYCACWVAKKNQMGWGNEHTGLVMNSWRMVSRMSFPLRGTFGIRLTRFSRRKRSAS